MRKFLVAPSISSDFNGYNYLSTLNHQLQSLDFEQISIDFSENNWFEANLCAVLGAILTESNKNLNDISLINLRNAQENIFSRNHFLASFGGAKILDLYDTTIKYRRNRMSDDKLIKEFLMTELINKPDFPKLSDAAKKEIIRSIFEIYSNAIIHGDCDDVFSCGQFYPNKIPPRIDFTIVDMGKTIQKNVNEFLQRKLSGIESIKWALSDNNTTKPKEKNIPGGLGFNLIQRFVKMNKGKIQIVSADGYWEFVLGKEEYQTLDYPFPGTIVNLEFNLDDNSFYYLKKEKNSNIIF
jgi:hypothetical protein